MNTIVNIFIQQINAEAEITRKFFKIVPENKYDWKPHPRSMTLKQLATHIAELPSWIPLAIQTDTLDFAVGDYKPTPISGNAELQSTFEENQKKALETLANTTDEHLQNSWSMRNGEQIYMTMSKGDVIRMAMSQTIHHRAQLGVFLRLLDIPIPGSYGPSADETGF